MTILRLTLMLPLLVACQRDPDPTEIFGGRWDVVDHQVAPACEDYAPADPAWSSFDLIFVDLEGLLGATLARCEGGCDDPSLAVVLDQIDEGGLGGIDVEAGLFAGEEEDFCQASVIELRATISDDDRLSVDVRTFFGTLTAPDDGDCDALVQVQEEGLCDEAQRFEAQR